MNNQTETTQPFIVLPSVLEPDTSIQSNISDLEDALSKEPANAETLKELGNIYLSLNDFDQAQQYYEKALNINPKNPVVLSNLGVMYNRKNEPDKGITYLIKALQYDKKEFKYYYNLGLCYYRKGDYSTALDYFSQALALNTQNAQLFSDLALVYRAQNDTKQAIDNYQQAILLDSENPERYTLLGSYYAEIQETEEAREYFLKALSLDPDYPKALTNMALLALAKQEYEETISLAKKVIKKNPEFLKAYKCLGMAYEAQEDYMEAINVFESLLTETSCKDYDIHLKLASLYERTQQIEAAIEAYLEINDLYNNDIHSLYALGYLYEQLEDYYNAAKYYEQMLEITTPSDDVVFRSLGYIYLKINNADKAVETLLKAKKINKANPAVYLYLAQAYIMKDEIKESLKHLRKSLELNPDLEEEAKEILAQIKEKSDLG